MTLAVHLKIAGVSLVLLAFAHLFFPRRFGWAEELARLSLLNRQMFQVHCFFIGLILLMFGLLSLVFTGTLLERSALGRVVLGGLVLFWLVRLFVQLWVYDPSLWRGHRFNTRVRRLLLGLWGYYVVVFGWALWDQR
jgi:hypothetical protein